MVNKKERILLIGSGLWYLGEGMLGPLFAVFTQRIGGDILEITSAWAIYLLILGVSTVILGKYSDVWNKEKMMICGYGLNAIFTFAYLLVHSSLSLFFVQAGLGLAAALATPTWDALYARYENKKTDGFDWGIADGMPHIVTAVSILVGGIIVTYLSFTHLFVIMGIIQVIATIYQANILKRR